MATAIRAQGSYLQRGAVAAATPQTISSITASGSLATLTTASAHGLATGSIVTITGATPAAYNGVFTVTVLTTTTFTFTTASAPGGAASVVGTYTAQTVTYATIEEPTDVKLGGVSVTSIDMTTLLSIAKESIAGLPDNGTAEGTFNFTNGTVQALVRADMNAGATSPYKIVIPGGATPINIGFSAYVTKLAGPDAKVDGKLEIQITLKITGAITIF
jgi:hypothetical protein